MTYTSARGVALPTYDRTAVPTFADIGVGAFARAHLGVYADDLLRRDYPALIRGVSIRSGRAAAQLVPQDGLYTVSEREPGRDGSPRLIGSMPRIASGVPAALEAVASATTHFVTLTVSEKGYEVEPQDLTDPAHPRSAPGVIALALDRRRRSSLPGPVIMSLDNVLSNGRTLRRCVTEVAECLDDALPAWIAEEVRFPNSVVDRLVPSTTKNDLQGVEDQLGLTDLAAVVSEHHRSWVIESVDLLPPLADVGVEVVESIAPYERRKLWLLNGPHSALAYCGLLANCTTIAAAVQDRRISVFVGAFVNDVLEVADLPARVAPGPFAREALKRFANPQLGHTCAQVGADGSRKLPLRLFPIMAMRHRRGLPTHRFAIVIALWLAAVSRIRIQGHTLSAVDDPAADQLRVVAATGNLHQLSHTALGHHGGPHVIGEVAETLASLMVRGMTCIDEAP